MAQIELPGILKEIVDAKRTDLESVKKEQPLSSVIDRMDDKQSPLNMSGALMGDSVRIIAEIKKASPSAGLLRSDFDPVSLATSYADNGAAAVSVLTNSKHFQGDIKHLENVQKVMYPRGIPVLRKEFIFDPYQIYESRAHGADAILLIVSILSPSTLSELLTLSQSFWMQCIVEVHDEEELDIALEAGAEIIGINNRDLRTFQTDLGVTERLAILIPPDKTIVSESGINKRKHINRLGNTAAHAFLIGEALITAADPGKKLADLL